MKKKLIVYSLLTTALFACNNSDRDSSGKSENDVDAARNFIQAALNGDYRKARTYMLEDTANFERMNAVERVNLSPDEKKGLAAATINIHNVNKLNDSTTVVIYSNSFKNNWDTLKVVRIKDEWLVDFDYLFRRDIDSLGIPQVLKDSLP